jgi:hypothetical protein
MAQKAVSSVRLLSAQKDSETNREWATKRGLALRYGVSLRCIDNWVYQKRIPSVKLGRLIRFRVARCDEALARFERREAR